ncbi:hypothetical protein J6590_016333 [Homalodisca vitripennis]|nr:hypothetical protein J6590_016333 [Homalodisca vitripennis]
MLAVPRPPNGLSVGQAGGLGRRRCRHATHANGPVKYLLLPYPASILWEGSVRFGFWGEQPYFGRDLLKRLSFSPDR